MTIEELKRKKHILEKLMRDLLSKFEDETNTTIQHLEIRRLDSSTLDQPSRTFVSEVKTVITI